MKHKRLQVRRPKHQPFTKLIPNLLTLLNLSAGVTAIRFALNNQFEEAVAAILLAGILDLLDGGMARLLNAGSKLGAELDSLADLVSFGVAPAVMVYAWTMHTAGGIGWVPSLLFCVCAALRLARFNIAQDEVAQPTEADCYFIGVPSPAAAGIMLVPMLLGFQYPGGPFIVVSALLMVSRIPNFSVKGRQLPQRYVVPVLLFVSLVVGFAVEALWATLTVLMSLYMVSIPISVVTFRRLQRKTQAAVAATQIDDGA